MEQFACLEEAINNDTERLLPCYPPPVVTANMARHPGAKKQECSTREEITGVWAPHKIVQNSNKFMKTSQIRG